MAKRTRAVRLPPDWLIPEPWISWARRQGMEEGEARQQAEMMKDWSLSSPRGAMLDWFAAWRNWVRREVRSAAHRPRRGIESAFDRQLKEMRDGQRH